MKYKVGDKVRVREDLKIGEQYGGCLFTEGMQNLAGRVVRITYVGMTYKHYRIDSYCCYWTDEMFEEVQGINKRVVINVDRNKVIAYCGCKEGVARCHPDDDFDFYTGAKIALERLEEAEKPYGWLKEGVAYYIPQLNFRDLFDSYVYDEDDFDKRNIERGIVFQTKEEAIACAKKMLAVVKQERENE